MLEVRVSIELGDSDGSTYVRVLRCETVMPGNPEDAEGAALQAAVAFDRIGPEALAAGREQISDFGAVLAREQQEKEEEA